VQDWVIRLVDWGGYAGVFLLSLLETIVFPLPSEVILPVAGMRAANGPLGLPGVILAATAGSMTGNAIWYFAARSIGLDRLRVFIERHGRWLALDWRDVERVQALFQRFGAGIVLVGRMLPVIRTFVSIPAGVARMSPARFLIWSTIGTFLFAAALAGAGFAAGTQFHRVDEIAGPVSSAFVAGILVWYLLRQLTWHRRAVGPVE
jgi:membrane protein DedA with SNARE-associated domain